jgi:hypothetical protein
MKTLLNVRVDQELKDEIDRLAKEDGISSSECARNILCDYLNYNEESKTTWVYEEPVEKVILYIKPDIKKELPQLALWLFVNLYSDSYYTEQNLESAKGFLENLTKNDKLSNELRFEFLKVLNDINRALSLGIHNTPSFFVLPDNMYTLNFNLLFAEVYNIINTDYRDDK